MSAKTSLSAEMKNAIVWLEKQPEVTSVVQGRYIASRHKHPVGFTRVIETDKKTVRLRTFDKRGSKDLFVYAPPSALRDRWVAALAGGDVFGPDGKTPKLAVITPVPPVGSTQSSVQVPTPQPVNAQAGQLFNVDGSLAAKWLERNTRNRPLRDDVVQRYAADMKAGRWMVTGDAIAFDKNGVIVNGQHRLWAVLESNMTIPMLVTFNLEPDVVRVLDDHLKRRLTDIVKISKPGSSMNGKIAAIAHVMQNTSVSLTAADKRAAIARLSRQQQMDFLEKHEKAIMFVARDCFHSTAVRGVTTANTLAAVARAYYSQDTERLKQFAKVLITGIPEDPRSDVGALLLRNWLLGVTTAALRARGEAIYRKSERALLAFCKRESIKMLYEANEELFPLPEETMPKRKSAS